MGSEKSVESVVKEKVTVKFNKYPLIYILSIPESACTDCVQARNPENG